MYRFKIDQQHYDDPASTVRVESDPSGTVSFSIGHVLFTVPDTDAVHDIANALLAGICDLHA